MSYPGSYAEPVPQAQGTGWNQYFYFVARIIKVYFNGYSGLGQHPHREISCFYFNQIWFSKTWQIFFSSGMLALVHEQRSNPG